MSNGRFGIYSAGVCASPAGTGIRPRFVKRVEAGAAFLVQVGETDQQALIDSYKEECDVNRIVERYANGDSSVLARVQGLYSDISGFADNATDLLNAPIKAREVLENLSSNVPASDASEAPETAPEASVGKSDVKEATDNA